MELGMVGLGRMGANMVERLVRGGHRVVGYDRDAGAVARVAAGGRRRRRFAGKPRRETERKAASHLDHGSFRRAGRPNHCRT